MTYTKLLEKRPEFVKKILGEKSKICLLNSYDIFAAIKDKKVIIMAANTRIKHVIPGLMDAARELDAVIGFELAKSECDLAGGYTGFTPEDFVNTILSYADEIKFEHPFFIHADHTTVKTTKESDFTSAFELIKEQLNCGYTSFSIDASFNPIPDNIKITTKLAKLVREFNYGLEVEVGEIPSVGNPGTVTTLDEAREFIEGLKENSCIPDLLAINNGSKHGNYLEGEAVHIDLERTGDIYNYIKGYGISIAQHGITGTPLHLIKRFTDYGIRKGNVGTQWQNIAHKHLPQDLFERMKNWASENKKDIKFTSKIFKRDIDSIPDSNRELIRRETCKEAAEFIKSFGAEGSATLLSSAF